MNILLDTNILIWSFDDVQALPAEVLAELRNRANRVYFSAVAIWEIAIKAALGRQDFAKRPERYIQAAREIGFVELPVTSAVAATVADLPPLHRDPFDRLLVAQAIAMPARLYTSDRRLGPYSELVTVVR